MGRGSPLEIPYTLVRSQRRTLALTLDAAGALTARAPLRMPQGEIEAFIRQKRGWIAQKQAALRERALYVPVWNWAGGAALPFWGGVLTARLAEVPAPRREGDTLLLPRSQPAHSALASWLEAQAPALLGERVCFHARRMGLTPSAIGYSTARTRWGSMSGKGSLRLNLALLLCPPPVAEYVIVHELAHMRQPNHSPAFWQVVAQWMPQHRQARAWLRQNTHLIRLLQKP